MNSIKSYCKGNNFLYKGIELIYYDKEPYKCISKFESITRLNYSRNTFMGWNILDVPIGDLEHYLKLLIEYETMEKGNKVQLRKDLNYVLCNLNRVELDFVSRYRLQYHLLFPNVS